MRSRDGIWLMAGLLAWLAGMAACAAPAADGAKDRLVVLYAGVHLVGIDEPVAHIALPGTLNRFDVAPSGHFLYQDDPTRAPHGVTGFMVGHLREPRRLAGVECPAVAGERMNMVRLSNKGDRIAWCLYHPEKRTGRLAITDAKTGKVVYEFAKPIAGDARVAFGEPAWSFDDERLAVLYLQSRGMEDDGQPMAMLLGVDLAERRAKAILPEAFWLYVAAMHRLRFSPSGGHVMFPRGDPKPFGDSWPHIVGFDGDGLRMAKDAVYLDDGDHMVVDLTEQIRPNGRVVTGRLQSVKTGRVEALQFQVAQDVRGQAWSVDGSWQAQAHKLPLENVNDLDRSAIRAVNTRTGEVHDLMTLTGVPYSRSLAWVRY